MIETLKSTLRALDVVSHEEVVLASGQKSEFYVDIKKAYGYPNALRLIVDALNEQIDPRLNYISCIAGMGHGGISPASILAVENNLHLALVRDKPKNHGKGGIFDGYIPNQGDKIAIVDDVFTTGGSLRKMIDVLKPTGAHIIGCFVVVKRGDGLLEVPLHHLLTTEDLK